MNETLPKCMADSGESQSPQQQELLRGNEISIPQTVKVPSARYEVVNNLNMILLSNAHTPIFVEREELPREENQKQFFVYEFSSIAGEIDPDFGEKIESNLGHYIRTELK
jgi:hypothetical protein